MTSEYKPTFAHQPKKKTDNEEKSIQQQKKNNPQQKVNTSYKPTFAHLLKTQTDNKSESPPKISQPINNQLQFQIKNGLSLFENCPHQKKHKLTYEANKELQQKLIEQLKKQQEYLNEMKELLKIKNEKLGKQQEELKKYMNEIITSKNLFKTPLSGTQSHPKSLNRIPPSQRKLYVFDKPISFEVSRSPSDPSTPKDETLYNLLLETFKKENEWRKSNTKRPHNLNYITDNDLISLTNLLENDKNFVNSKNLNYLYIIYKDTVELAIQTRNIESQLECDPFYFPPKKEVSPKSVEEIKKEILSCHLRIDDLENMQKYIEENPRNVIEESPNTESGEALVKNVRMLIGLILHNRKTLDKKLFQKNIASNYLLAMHKALTTLVKRPSSLSFLNDEKKKFYMELKQSFLNLRNKEKRYQL